MWAGLLFGSRGELASGDEPVRTETLMLGSPTADIPTRTVTVTIAYKPTLAVGDATFTLLGCYGEPNGGHVLGQDGQYETLEEISGERLTIEECLEGCENLKPPDGGVGQYTYAGAKNGR